MKNTTTLFVFVAIAGWLHAQITITSETFPVAGDTLRTAIDNTNVPLEALHLLPGGPQTWDFSFLSKDILRTTVYQPASEGAAFGNFPEADFMTVDPDGRENYYDADNSSYRLIGQNGIGFLDVPLPVELRIRYNPPLTEREAPFNFFDTHAYSSGTLQAFDNTAFPAEVLNLFQFIADSFRVRIAIFTYDAGDAYGTAVIPGGIYEVLRKDRTTFIEKRLDAKIAPLGWLDVTDQAKQIFGWPFGIDTLYYYFYFGAMEKEPIVTVGYNTVAPFNYNRVPIVEFKDVNTISAITDPSVAQPELILSPNPVNDHVRYSCRSFSPGRYVMHVVDAGGNRVMTQPLTLSDGTLSTAQLTAGVYFYQVLDETSRVIVTGKLVKAGS